MCKKVLKWRTFQLTHVELLENGWRCDAFDKQWILFRSMQHLPRLSQGRNHGDAKMCKNMLKWRNCDLTGWITGKRLKIDGYMLRCVWRALNALSIHVKFIAIVPGTYPGEAKMCLRLSWRSQMLAPATTYRRDSWGSQIMCLRLIVSCVLSNKQRRRLAYGAWSYM